MKSVRKYLYMFCFILYGFLYAGGVNSQSLDSLPPGFQSPGSSNLCYDSANNYLYAAGWFNALYDGTPMNRISRWDGMTWDSLGSGVNDGGTIMDMVIYHNELIVAGSFQSIGGVSVPGLAKWDGTNWISMGITLSIQTFTGSDPGFVYTLYVDGNDLYIGGEFDSLNGSLCQSIARFDGTTWYSYPPVYYLSCAVWAITKYNNELYIGGNFSIGLSVGPCNDIAKFDGNDWVSVGGGFSGGNTWVTDFAIYQNLLYVTGYFLTSQGDPGNNVAIWDGTNWSQADQGVMPANPFDSEVFNDKYYVAGQISNASGIPVTFIAVWDGNNWNSFDNHIFDLAVTCFAQNQNTLFMAGAFTMVDGIPFRRILQYNLTTGTSEILENCFKIVPANELNTYELIVNCPSNTDDYFIYNQNGQIIKQIDTVNNLNFLDLSGLPAGLYFLVLRNQNRSFSQKLIKL